MASSYPGPVSAVQVGSYFVGQYYQVLQQQPNLVYQFYSDDSTMIRVDGESSHSADEMMQIHNMILSLYFTSIEIKTINSVKSLGGGVLVMVTGSVKSKEFVGRRRFAQTFFLAPQNKGYYVLNDIFQFLEEEVALQHPGNMITEGQFDINLNASSPHRELPVADYVLEEEPREYVNSVDVEDNPVDKYSRPEQQYSFAEQQVYQNYETEVVVEETPQEEVYASYQNPVSTVQDTTAAASVEEPVGEPQKRSWASILRVAKEPSAPQVIQQPSVRSVQTTADWNHTPQPPVEQSNSTSEWSYTPQPNVEAAESSMPEDEGEMKSVYVRNLPPTVTEGEIEEEFKHFGQIIRDGVFVRARKEIGVCYAFVEFEDMVSVHNALKASPIYLAGRQVYIEGRRPNSGIAARGRGRGRGRGSYPIESTRGRFGGRSSGRGGYQDTGDYNKGRGNGFQQRGTR